MFFCFKDDGVLIYIAGHLLRVIISRQETARTGANKNIMEEDTFLTILQHLYLLYVSEICILINIIENRSVSQHTYFSLTN